MRVVIVCTGNTCRSPMAGGLLKSIAAERGLEIEVRTAGLSGGWSGYIAGNAIAVMQELGIDITDDYPKSLTASLVEWADVVLAVKRKFAMHICEDCPCAERKVQYLECDVPDPYCGGLQDYREARDLLRRLLLRFVDVLAAR